MAMLDYIKLVNAQQNFKILDEFALEGFDDVSDELESEEGEDVPHLDIWVELNVKLDGTVPESYRILNAMVGDWVEAHEKALTDAIHPKLIEFLKESYPDIDLREIEKGFEESPIWQDQLDYMPRLSDDEKSMVIEIELVLEHEELKEEE